MDVRPDHVNTVVITYPKLRYNPNDVIRFKQYCHHQLIKYSDWDNTNIDSIKNIDTAIERWNEFIKTAPQEVLNSINFTNELSKELQLARQELDPEFEPPVYKENWMELAEIRPSIIEDDADEIIADKNYDFISHRNNYTEQQLEKMENEWITRLKKNVNDDKLIDTIPDVDPSAGTGKTYTIYAISKLLKESVQRCAPTAKAAYLIHGETVHSLFIIKTDQKSYSLPLKSKNLQKLQDRFKGVTHIIIDEYSMLSQAIFGVIDLRLRQATGLKNQMFGGLSIILTGDPGQLNPVGGSPLYYSETNNLLTTQAYSNYLKFDKVICLEKTVRQQNLDNDPDQEYFLKLLPRIRDGVFDDKSINDWKFLLKREVKPNMETAFKDAIRLFPDNATSVNEPPSARSIDEENFYELKNTINIAINAKITLTTNLWT
ncbi:ATP-dependent DNA helicase PIF1, partial [Brachionus plicatilis]